VLPVLVERLGGGVTITEEEYDGYGSATVGRDRVGVKSSTKARRCA
jgi:hypothetical protein